RGYAPSLSIWIPAEGRLPRYRRRVRNPLYRPGGARQFGSDVLFDGQPHYVPDAISRRHAASRRSDLYAGHPRSSEERRAAADRRAARLESGGARSVEPDEKE